MALSRQLLNRIQFGWDLNTADIHTRSHCAATGRCRETQENTTEELLTAGLY